MKNKKPKRQRPVRYESVKDGSSYRRPKMNLEPRTVEMSQDNLNSCVETFLRATDVIKDSETPTAIVFDSFVNRGVDPLKVTIYFQQEVQQPVDQTVH